MLLVQSDTFQRHMKTLITLLGVLVVASAQLPEDDEVLTGFPNYTHPIYSGYLDISVFYDPKAVHYVYYESQKDAAKDPVILWLAGGPGCSGLLTMLQQNGPFLIAPGTEKMSLNQNSWNKNAGLVYFDLPAGVGYSRAAPDQKMDDESTTAQALVALRLFLDRHSSLKKSELYLAGSGYGGIFAVKLARGIVEANKDPASIYEDKILLKGLLMGNPCVNPDECFVTGSERSSFYHYEFLYKRGFIAKSTYEKFLGRCKIVSDPFACYQQRQLLDADFNATNTSAYNIYGKCYRSRNNSINLGCEDETGPINYLNDPDFRRNWNIRVTEGLRWEPCNQQIWLSFISGNGTYHLLHQLIQDSIRLWVYSGDMDSTVPSLGTRKWLKIFKAEYQVPVKTNWREWWVPGKHKHEDQVGGFIWDLEGLTFVAVKGAGFKAAQDQPAAMSEVLEGFLAGKTLPYQS